MTAELEVGQGGRCRVCKRVLRSAASREAGIGPVCTRKAAAVSLVVDGNIRTHYDVVRVTRDFVFITDETVKRGGRSVTNAAEQVVADLLAKHPGRRIVYRDTDGTWDELVHDGTKFATFAPAGEIAARELAAPC